MAVVNDYYSRHLSLDLSVEEQKLIEKASKLGENACFRRILFSLKLVYFSVVYFTNLTT